MTRRALGLLLVAAALYLFANQVQVGWLYVFVSLLLAVMGVSAVAAWLAVRGLEVDREARGTHPTVFQDEEVEFRLRLRRRGWLPKHFLTVQEYCPIAAPGERLQTWFLVEVGERTTLPYRVRAYKRGHYRFPPLLLESRGPFGIFRARRRPVVPDALTVYPRYDGLEVDLVPLERAVAEAGRNGTGEGDEIYGTREFRQGDSLRQVDWRGTARRGALIVREREQLVRLRIEAILDHGGLWGQGRETTLEYAIRAAAATADLARRHGHPFHLRDGGAAPYEWWPMLHYLAGVQPQAGLSVAALIAQAPPDTLLVLPLARLDAEVRDALQAARARGIRILPVALVGFGAPGEATLFGELRAIGLNPIVWRAGEPAARA